MIAQDSNLKATGAQHPYDQGMANGMLAAYALIGKPAPAYVVIPGQQGRPAITSSVPWKAVFHQPPSKDLIDAAGPQKAVEVPTLPPPAVITTTTK